MPFGLRARSHPQPAPTFTDLVQSWPEARAFLGYNAPGGESLHYEDTFIAGRSPTPLPSQAPYRQVGLGYAYGWLPAPRISPASHLWSFFFSPNVDQERELHPDGTIWEAASLPPSWNGCLADHLLSSGKHPSLLMGVIRDPAKPAYASPVETWFVQTRPTLAPLWPALGPGRSGQVTLRDATLLGIFRRERRPTSGSNLFAALATRGGQFLGWLPLKSTSQFAAFTPHTRLDYQALPGWDQVEADIRQISWDPED